MAFLGVEPTSAGVALAEGLRDREGGPCPLWIIPWHLPYKWGKAWKTSVRTTRCADLAIFWGAASAGLLLVSSPRLPGGLQSALGRHKSLPSCRTKGFPVSANFESKLSVSALIWSAKDGIPKSSWIWTRTLQEALYTARSKMRVGFDDANWCSGRAGCCPMGEGTGLRKRDDEKRKRTRCEERRWRKKFWWPCYCKEKSLDP
jgi:hypothetical protein